MPIRDKVQPYEFTLTTTLDDAKIREAGSRAAQAGKRTLGGVVKENGLGQGYIDYVIKGPGGLVTWMQMRLHITGAAGSGRKCRLEVGDFMTSRPTLFGFIPMGPRSVQAKPSLAKFSEWFTKELSQA